MKERGMVFGTELIPAIQKDLKTMTRRVMNPQPKMKLAKGELPNTIGLWFDENGTYWRPPLQKGDLIWVKEVYCVCDAKLHHSGGNVCYKADGESDQPICTTIRKWKSPRFMFKKYARIWLEITKDPRAERLWDITNADVFKEGCALIQWATHPEWRPTARFAQLWDSLNTKHGHGWDKNEFVFVYEFKRIER